MDRRSCPGPAPIWPATRQGSVADPARPSRRRAGAGLSASGPAPVRRGPGPRRRTPPRPRDCGRAGGRHRLARPWWPRRGRARAPRARRPPAPGRGAGRARGGRGRGPTPPGRPRPARRGPGPAPRPAWRADAGPRPRSRRVVDEARLIVGPQPGHLGVARVGRRPVGMRQRRSRQALCCRAAAARCPGPVRPEHRVGRLDRRVRRRRPERAPGHAREEMLERLGVHRSQGLDMGPGLARPPGRGGRLGGDGAGDRPGAAGREVVRGRRLGGLEVAAPPARLGEIGQAGGVEGSPPVEVLELGPGQGQLAEAKMEGREPPVLGEIGRAHADPLTLPRPSSVPSCRQLQPGLEAAEVASRRHDRHPQEVVADQGWRRAGGPPRR